jgi:hypothetical protein
MQKINLHMRRRTLKRSAILMLLLYIPIPMLTSCAKNPISVVKDGVLDFDKSIAIGQAFDKYKYFKSVEWKLYKAENGRNTVECTGVLDVPELKGMGLYRVAKTAYLTIRFIPNVDKTVQIESGWLNKDKGSTKGSGFGMIDLIDILQCIYRNQPFEAPVYIKSDSGTFINFSVSPLASEFAVFLFITASERQGASGVQKLSTAFYKNFDESNDLKRLQTCIVIDCSAMYGNSQAKTLPYFEIRAVKDRLRTRLGKIGIQDDSAVNELLENGKKELFEAIKAGPQHAFIFPPGILD